MKENINTEFFQNFLNSENKILYLENKGWYFLHEQVIYKWFKNNKRHLIIDSKYFNQ